MGQVLINSFPSKLVIKIEQEKSEDQISFFLETELDHIRPR